MSDLGSGIGGLLGSLFSSGSIGSGIGALGGLLTAGAGATQSSMAGIGATALGPMYAQQAQAQNQKGNSIGSLIGTGLTGLLSFGI